MIKRCLLPVFFCIELFFSPNAIAQNRNSIWVFGDSAGIDFSNVLNPVTLVTNCTSRGSCTSIADSLGNFLFYTGADVGIVTIPGSAFNRKIYNRQFQVMDNGDSINFVGWFNDCMIIPNPSGQNKFYLFHVSVAYGQPQPHGLFYSEIDLSFNGGLGKVISKNHLLQSGYFNDATAAVRHGNGRDWWFICKPFYIDVSIGTVPSDTFYVYLITPDSIHPPIKQQIGSTKGGGVGNLTFSSKGDKINFSCARGGAEIIDFDRCSGNLSNAVVLDSIFDANELLWGSAFSPDDSLLYVINAEYPFYFYQIDLATHSLDTIAEITGTQTVVNRGRSPCSIRLAPDGKIYMAAAYTDTLGYLYYPYNDSCYFAENMYLGVVNNPNVKGLGCNFDNFGFYLGGKRTYWGLPNNPDYELGALAGSGCDTLTSLTPDPSPFEREVRIFPNPVSSELKIENSKFKIQKLEMYDIIGNMVWEKKVNKQESTIKINVSALSGGAYFIKAFGENGVAIRRFVKE